MLKINTTSKYAELKFDDKSDLYPLNEISYTVENESETVSFYNRFYNKIVTEQIANIQVNDVPVTRDNIQDLLSVLFAGYEGSGGSVDLSNYYTKPEANTLLDNKVDKVDGKQLSTEDYTTEEKTKLESLHNYDDTTVKADIAANTAAITAEVTRAKTAENTLNSKIPTLQSNYIGNNKNFVYSEGNTGGTKNVISKIDASYWEQGMYLRSYYWGKDDGYNSASCSIDVATDKKAGIMGNFDRINLNYLTGYEEVTPNESGYLQLLDNKITQYTVITGNTHFSLPIISYDKYKELHLIFEGVTGSTITLPYNVVWKETPTAIVEGATYEFIFTWVKSQNKWYGGYIKYE